MDYSGYEYILTEYEDGVLTVTFNRPEARNALNPGMQREFRDILEKLETDEEVGAVILTGAGDRAFCAGVDIKSRDSALSDANPESTRPNTAFHSYIHPKRMIERILNVEAPIIVALNGDAVGLGCSIALSGDIIVANETARLADTHIKTLGVVAGDGGTIHLPLSMSIYKAKEYLLTGAFLSAKDAAAMGMINYALPHAEMMAKARELAVQLAASPRWAMRWTKASINRIVRERSELTMDLATALEGVTLASEDHRESMRAWIERRPPRYTGR